ncbi:MAG: glycosyl transferase [Halieaceae bacterium]
MSDFFQNGTITTLHDLGDRSTESYEDALVTFSQKRPIGLILPSLYSELGTEALPNIVKELTRVPYLSQVVIGLDRADQSEYQHAIDFFGQLPQHHRVLWNDGPRLRAIDQRLQEAGLAPRELGKGRNVWYCMGYALATAKADAIALHDCDILTYDRSLLARLVYPVANPLFNYEFCKGYYPRVADNKINGRVCRLLVTPMIRAMKRVVGDSQYLAYLDSYRYILAGEFAFRRELLNDLRIPSDWGLEIGVVSEVYRSNNNRQICQVDIAHNYDHKHQNLSLDDATLGLSRMSMDIAKSIFRKLAIQGTVFNQETFRTIKATYYRMALDLVEAHRDNAIMNGLGYDIHQEEVAVELFAENIMEAGKQFLERPMDAPFIPTWNRVVSAIPEILDDLREAVEEDYLEFGVDAGGSRVRAC